MRNFFYAAGLVCLLAARPVWAQPARLIAPPPAAVALAPPRAAIQPTGLPAPQLARAGLPVALPDTAAALHRLFKRRRTRHIGSALGLLVFGTGLTVASVVSAHHASDPLSVGFDGFGAIVAGTATGILVPLELLRGAHYSRRKERQAIAQWQAHQLPPALRQALAPKYFAPSAP